jgi:hypothetical protein
LKALVAAVVEVAMTTRFDPPKVTLEPPPLFVIQGPMFVAKSGAVM